MSLEGGNRFADVDFGLQVLGSLDGKIWILKSGAAPFSTKAQLFSVRSYNNKGCVSSYHGRMCAYG